MLFLVLLGRVGRSYMYYCLVHVCLSVCLLICSCGCGDEASCERVLLGLCVESACCVVLAHFVFCVTVIRVNALCVCLQ
jgi:hypothetical protein